jgi:hypothetical protein
MQCPHDRHNPYTFFVIFKKCAEVIAHVRTVHDPRWQGPHLQASQ